MLLALAAGRKGRQGQQANDPNMRILYKHPYPGIPVVETTQLRSPGDIILGYVVDVRSLTLPVRFP